MSAVTTRSELIYLLTQAAELEHALAVQYLYTAFTLKTNDDPSLTPAQAVLIQGWRSLINKIAGQEMYHLALVCNLLTAVGGAPNLRRPPFPQTTMAWPTGLPTSLAPFSVPTIQNYICWEKPEGSGWWEALCPVTVLPAAPDSDQLNPIDLPYRSLGELYDLIALGFEAIPQAIIGPPAAQITNAYVPFRPPLIAVLDLPTAAAAIQRIRLEGEGRPTNPLAESHFAYFTQIYGTLREELHKRPDFEPARRVVSNPIYSFRSGQVPAGATLITHPLTRQVGEIATACYDLLLQLLMRFFSHGRETPDQLRVLATSAQELMSATIRPLGALLTQLPAAPAATSAYAGLSFEMYESTQPLPDLTSAWIYFRERLGQIAAQCHTVAHDPGWQEPGPPALPAGATSTLIWAGMAVQEMIPRFRLPPAPA